MTQNDGQELPSVFSMIAARKGLVIKITVATLAAGIAYTFFAKAVWEAKTTIVFPIRTPSLLGVGNFEQSSLASSFGGPTPLKIFSGVLDSEHALSLVANGSGLKKREVKEMRSIDEQSMENTITISARSTDPDLAKKIVALHIEALQQINTQIAKPLAGDDVDVLKSKLDEQQKKVALAENKLLDFRNHALTAPTIAASGSGANSEILPSTGRWASTLRQLELDYNRVDTSIRNIAQRTHTIALEGGKLPSTLAPVQKWRDKLTDMQYDLQIQQLTLAPTAPEIVKLQKEIAVTRNELRTELDKYGSAASAGMVDPIGGKDSSLPELLTQRVVLDAQLQAVGRLAKLAPGEEIELLRLTREVATQSTILQTLQVQCALAQVQAERDPNRWQVLDSPEVEDKPINKSFSKNGILAVVAGLALGCLSALYAPKRKPKKMVEATGEHVDEERKAA